MTDPRPLPDWPGYVGAFLALVLIATFGLTSCSDDDGTPAPTTTTFPVETIVVGDGDAEYPSVLTFDDPAELGGSLYRIDVDGMPCIIWKQRKGSDSKAVGYGGITCDWSDR